jgi:hypothetical protein
MTGENELDRALDAIARLPHAPKPRSRAQEIRKALLRLIRENEDVAKELRHIEIEWFYTDVPLDDTRHLGQLATSIRRVEEAFEGLRIVLRSQEDTD